MLLSFLVFVAGSLMVYLGVTGASIRELATGFFTEGTLPS